jgi:archaellum biogenesis ATPase FlaH
MNGEGGGCVLYQMRGKFERAFRVTDFLTQKVHFSNAPKTIIITIHSFELRMFVILYDREMINSAVVRR